MVMSMSLLPSLNPSNTSAIISPQIFRESNEDRTPIIVIILDIPTLVLHRFIPYTRISQCTCNYVSTLMTTYYGQSCAIRSQRYYLATRMVGAWGREVRINADERLFH